MSEQNYHHCSHCFCHTADIELVVGVFFPDGLYVKGGTANMLSKKDETSRVRDSC
jgi:hypothetical protein